MKKLFSILLALTLVTALFVGCGGSDSDESSDSGSTDSNTTDTSDEGSDTTDSTPMVEENEVQEFELVVWEQMEPASQELFDQVAADFMAEYPEITVVRNHYETEDLRTNFQNASLAGEGPSLVYGPSDNIGVFQASGVIQPVTNVLTEEFLAQFDQISMDVTKLGGEYYMVPEINGNQIAMVYNKDLVPEPPKTWDELVTVAKSFRSNVDDPENATYGFLYNEAEPYWFVGFYNGFGGAVMDENNNPTLNNQAMIDALTFVRDIRQVQGLGMEGMNYDIADSMFKSGNAAIILNGAWSWSSYEDAGMNLGIAKAPVLPSGSTPIFYNATKGYSVPDYVTDDAEIAAIQTFLGYFMNAENNAKFALASSQAPTNMESRQLDEIKTNPLQIVSVDTIEATTGMPIVAEMRGIWDAIRPELEAVLNAGKDPAEAAAAMQDAAEEFIAEIRAE